MTILDLHLGRDGLPATTREEAAPWPGTGRPEPTDEQRLRHDLRQSLGLLMALAALVQQGLAQSADQQSHGQHPGGTPRILGHLEQIRREADRMAAMASSLGAADAAPQLVDVSQVVVDAWRSAMAAAPCGMQLACDAATPATVDPVGLARSVQNLLDNAVRASGSDGTVSVQVRDRGGWVSVTVSDTGPGFGNVPTQQGLGLVTVRRFAAGCGGSLEVAASRDRGAELVLRIPSATVTSEVLTCAS